MTRWLLPVAALLGAVIGAGAMLASDRARGGPVGAEVRAYLLDHPEVIAQAMTRLQDRDTARLVAAHRAAIVTPYAGAWAGNPRGDVAVVEYFDYNCSYCRASLPVIAQLLQDDPGVRLVYREAPILAESSRTAARVSLAAARQGHYAAFHQALYAAGPVSDATIAAAARAARVDPARVPDDAMTELHRNVESYAALGMGGTPSWVIGDRVLSGAQTLDALKAAVATARGR